MLRARDKTKNPGIEIGFRFIAYVVKGSYSTVLFFGASCFALAALFFDV